MTQEERLRDRKVKLLKVLEDEGTCTLRYAHHRLKRDEKTLTKNTVIQMAKSMPEVSWYKIKDLVLLGGRPRAQGIVVLKRVKP